MSTLLDHLARRLGYVRLPVPPAQPISEPESDRTPPTPPHLKARGTFDYGRVKDQTDWASFYDTDDGFHYAIGRDGWMPVLMAGFLLGHNRSDGLALFSTAISRRLWLPKEAAIHTSWIDANEEAIAWAQAIEVVSPEIYDNSETFEPSMFSQFPASIVSMELRTMWRRCYPYQRETLLSTTHGHVLFSRLDMLQEAKRAPKAALAQLLTWTAEWFAARGIQVNHEQMLIQVPGYQPLFLFDSEPGAF